MCSTNGRTSGSLEPVRKALRHARFPKTGCFESSVIRSIRTHQAPPSAVMPALAAIRSLPGHSFWAEKISIADESCISASHLSSHARVTDIYLLALAKSYGGRLATMDHRIASDAIPGGQKVLELI